MKYFILLLTVALWSFSQLDALPAWEVNVPMHGYPEKTVPTEEQIVPKEEPVFNEKINCNTQLGMECGDTEMLSPEPVTEKYYPYKKESNEIEDSNAKESRDSTAHIESNHIVHDFEGDIVATVEEIEKMYYMSEQEKRQLEASAATKRGVHYQAAHNEEGTKWQDRTVPYKIDDDFSQAEKRNIEQAIEGWQSVTCLRFIERTIENDYIYFIKPLHSNCNSLVGRRGGKQTINLPTWCVNSIVSIQHEIGHSLGLWHEQSRPDRDSYITILSRNIFWSDLFNFDKRKDKYIDFQDSQYDYRSIMHYNLDAFANCQGCKTMQINNWEAYNAQGKPIIGHQYRISPKDGTEISRLYNCPGAGVAGSLWVKISYGQNLRDLDIPERSNKPYINISAVDFDGVEYLRQTSIKFDTKFPVWNEWFSFPGSFGWQLLRLRVWDHLTNTPMTMSQTIALQEHAPKCSNCLHCANVACDVNVTYEYQVLRDRLFYVHIKFGINLPDMDPEDNTLSDPYVSVAVYNLTGQATVWNTTYWPNTRYPMWNEKHKFDYGPWRSYEIQLFDKNAGMIDTQISTLAKINLPYYGNMYKVDKYYPVGRGSIKMTIISYVQHNF